MSTGTDTPLPAQPTAVVAPPPTACEVVIERRLRQTQRHVKGVDIAGGLIALGIGVLAYLLAAAVIDHWLIVGGLGFSGRLWLWLTLVGAAGLYFFYRLLPPLMHRINPIFAAATIERSQPTLKNSLINFLLLRGRRQEIAPPVYQAMEHRAATDLATVEIDVAVDRTHIIRLGSVLAAVLAVFCLYLVLSPKSPIRSAARVLWPWSNVEAPTRVTLRDIQPGDAVAFNGDTLTVSADVAGLREGEQPLLVYTTADGQAIDQAIPMTRPEGDYRYECRLPPDKLGLQQDYRYFLAAGDCRTRRYQIAVQNAPAIVVDKVAYHYPSYVGAADQTFERQGDVRAIEGTEITIYGTANSEIKPGTAEIDLGCTGRHGLRMTIDGRAAVGRFTLRLSPNDPSRPEYDSYQLRFADLQGHENQRPIRHRIEVIRDLPPTVQLVEPQQKEVQVAADGALTIKVRAEDADFGLRSVRLRVQHNDRVIPIAPLLQKKHSDRAWPGEFSATYTFEPAKLDLKAGDRVEYWAEAEDSREPVASQAATDKQWITIARPDGRKTASGDRADGKTVTDGRSGKAQSGQNAESKAATCGRDESAEKSVGEKSQPGEPKTNQQPADPSEQSSMTEGQDAGKEPSAASAQEKGKQLSGEQPSEQQQLAQASEKPDEKIDPDTAPGDAMQEILNDRQKQQQQSAADQPKSDQQQSEKQQSGDREQKPGDQKQSEGNQSGGKNSGGEKGAGEKAGGERDQGGKAGGQTAAGEKPASEKAGNEKPAGEKTGGQKGTGQDAAGEKGAGEQAAGEKAGQQSGNGDRSKGEKSDSETSTAETTGQKKDANGESGGEKTAGEKGRAGESNAEKSSADKTGNEQATGQKSSEKQAGDKTQPKETPGADTTTGEKSGSQSGSKQTKDTDGQQAADQKKSGEQQPGAEKSAGAGKSSGDDKGAPMPQEANQPREKKAGEAGEKADQEKGDMAQSPSTSKKQSDSQGQTAGDHSGGGQEGGGQQANQPGVGGPGSNTPADEGGSKSAEKGEGEVGAKSGDQAVANKPTGSADKKQTGEGGEEKGASGGQSQAAASGKSDGRGTPQENPPDGGTPGKGTSEGPVARGAGSPTGGGKPGTESDATAPAEAVETPADRANLEYARRQTELALEHLRDQLAKEKPGLLERLGWSKDDARRFLDRWAAMKQAAQQEGRAGEAARKHFDDALRSLGLRPRGTVLGHGGVTTDRPQNLRDAGRFAPPPEWAEQFREYTRGVAGGERK